MASRISTNYSFFFFGSFWRIPSLFLLSRSRLSPATSATCSLQHINWIDVKFLLTRSIEIPPTSTLLQSGQAMKSSYFDGPCRHLLLGILTVISTPTSREIDLSLNSVRSVGNLGSIGAEASTTLFNREIWKTTCECMSWAAT